jgi:hypothetical protein
MLVSDYSTIIHHLIYVIYRSAILISVVNVPLLSIVIWVGMTVHIWLCGALKNRNTVCTNSWKLWKIKISVDVN